MMAIGPIEAAAMRRESDSEIIGIVAGRQVTRAQLRVAFELVENREHWKNPIDRTVPIQQVEAVGGIPMITEAVRFFAGCIPSFDRVPAGYRIQASGYYAAVGA